MSYHWRLRDRTMALGSRCLVMGIVNVTPDSFSDGGAYLDHDRAIAHALDLVRQGADLLDVGGESTRPGSLPVSVEEELSRVVPVVAALARETSVPVSIDTSKAMVARACLEVGAQVVNDVTALTGDAEMPAVARDFRAGLIVMHMQGTPMTMQLDPKYDDVVADVVRYLRERLDALVAGGIDPEAIMVDPGIGFGKRHQHNLTLLANLAAFASLGRPLCLGVSRKGFIGKIIGKPPRESDIGSLAVGAFGLAQDAVHLLRVHDVEHTRDLIVMWDALRNV